MLRSIEHGDYDKIVTFFTVKRGKTTLIAKGAKKSSKRFAGVLELFSILEVVWSCGRGSGLAVLNEASLVRPFEMIRTSVVKTAYASYWCELICLWMEEGHKQDEVFGLLEFMLDQLNLGGMPWHALHIVFSLRFMSISGFSPGLSDCNVCGTPVDGFGEQYTVFDVRRGGILCEKCADHRADRLELSKGTIKLLQWALKAPLDKLNRLKFSRQAIEEGLRMIDAFVHCHLGKETKSLKFLKQIDPGPGH